MKELIKPSQNTYFIAYGLDGQACVGVVAPYQVLSTGQPQLEFDADPERFAAIVETTGFIDKLPTLPLEGERCFKTSVYNHNGKAVVCYQTHDRMHFDPSETPALFGLAKFDFDAWVQPTGGHDAYKLHDIVSFNSKHYKSLIDANVWNPETYPAGWLEIA